MSHAEDSKDAATKITMPTSLDACQALIEQLTSTVEELTDANEKLRLEKERIAAEYAAYVQRMWARRSERYINDPNQLRLDLGDNDQAVDAAEGLAQAVEEAGIPVKSHVRRKRKPRNESLPENLQRVEVVVDAPEDVKNCPEHGPRQLIGYDIVETLVYEPPKLFVRQTKYPKYACPPDPMCGVASPERAIGLVEGNRYDTSVAAEIITAKYGYHGVQGEAVSEMRVGPSWPGDRTRPQTSPNCGGQESSWEASGVKGAA